MVLGCIVSYSLAPKYVVPLVTLSPAHHCLGQTFGDVFLVSPLLPLPAGQDFQYSLSSKNLENSGFKKPRMYLFSLRTPQVHLASFLSSDPEVLLL